MVSGQWPVVGTGRGNDWVLAEIGLHGSSRVPGSLHKISYSHSAFLENLSQFLFEKFRRDGEEIVCGDDTDEAAIFDDRQAADVFLSH